MALWFMMFVVDLSRMYAQKNELNTLADAASLSASIQLMIDTSTVKSTAISYGSKNKVLKNSVTLSSADIVCGNWNDSTKAFTANGWCSAQNNAVRITARDSAKYLFAGLGAPKKQLAVSATAWLAFVGATDCVKPWSLFYTILTKTLQPSNPDTLRNLTPYDLALLSTLPRANRRFLLKIGSGGAQGTPGNFGALDIPNPLSANSGGNLYRDNIGMCNPTSLGIGMTTNLQTGNLVGPTKQGAQTLCTVLTAGGECRNPRGTMGIVVNVPLWSDSSANSTGSSQIVIRQIATFSLDTMTNNAEIIGAFVGGRRGGTIVRTTGTLRRPILVQ